MNETYSGVKAFVAEGEEYLACLDAEVEAAGEEQTDEENAIYVSRYNAAVDAMQALAEQFNVELRAYKAIHEQ